MLYGIMDAILTVKLKVDYELGRFFGIRLNTFHEESILDEFFAVLLQNHVFNIYNLDK